MQFCQVRCDTLSEAEILVFATLRKGSIRSVVLGATPARQRLIKIRDKKGTCDGSEIKADIRAILLSSETSTAPLLNVADISKLTQESAEFQQKN